ncbi:MAG: GntR family transcriptional regulator [Pseudomonadota bacterium]
MSKASERAYQEIRQRILSGALAPGAHLKEEELAETCGVSRTPVRDALRQLEAEYYVRRAAGRRTFVSQWTRGDIEDIFALRALMEGYAAERAASRIKTPELARLRHHHGEIDKVLRARGDIDADTFLAHNREFHALITSAAASERLSLMLQRLVEQPVVMRTFIAYRREDLLRSNQHHGDLVEALAAGDAAWARSVMTAHIQAAFHVHKRAVAGAQDAAGQTQPSAAK